MRVATDYDQTDGQRLGGKIGLAVDVLRISKSNTAMHCSLPALLKEKDDIHGRNQLLNTCTTDLWITLASENFHRGRQTIPTSLVINRWGQIVYLLVP